MQNYEETLKFLDAPIPRDVISKRSAGNGMKLDYLEGWYVIDRMNQVFGNTGWSYSITSLKEKKEYTMKDKYGKDVYCVVYEAVVRLAVPGKDGPAYYEDVGHGSGRDKNDPGRPFELASKEAVTDALKRTIKNLGRSMGLALYDKSQEYVTDGKNVSVASKTVSKGNGSRSTAPVKDLTGAIRSTYRAAVAKKNGSAEKAKKYLADKYGVDNVDGLNKNQAEEYLGYLRTAIMEA